MIITFNLCYCVLLLPMLYYTTIYSGQQFRGEFLVTLKWLPNSYQLLSNLGKSFLLN